MNIQYMNVSKLIRLKENSDYRYRGSKFEGLKSSIEKVGVLTPISVGKLGDEFHIADGNRRTYASRVLKLETIPALIKEVKNRDELQELFMEHTKFTHNIGSVQLVDMYLKGMNPKYINTTIRKSIKVLNSIYGNKAKTSIILKRMVSINKSPRSYVLALENLEKYLLENDNSFKIDNSFRKGALYWMLNCGSPWAITNNIKSQIPV